MPLIYLQMHLVLKYYESPGATREAKVKETLETMGASILVGGLSTFLGVIPLAFSTSAILRTVFIAFFAMVSLGLTHGLILLPVVLSIMGPMVCLPPHNTVDDDSSSEEQSHSSEHDLRLVANPTKETTMGVSVGSQTSEADAHSISSDETGSPKRSLPDATQIEETVAVRLQGQVDLTMECTDVVEC